jgi:hypothetical protein
LKKSYGGKGDVATASAVQRELDGLGLSAPPPSGVLHDKLVVWNQNNGGKGDRGSRKVNIVLLDGGREVWKKTGWRLTWSADKQAKDEIDIPAIKWDKLRVEVTEMINQRGGLSEVVVQRGGKNVLLGATVIASGYWETDPKHAPSMLTDGLPETFWLLNDKQDGWVEITPKLAGN